MRASASAQATRTLGSLSVSASTSARAVAGVARPAEHVGRRARAAGVLGLAELHERVAPARLVAQVDVLGRVHLAEGGVEPGEVEVGRQVVGVDAR